MITLKIMKMLVAPAAAQQELLNMRNPHLGFGMHAGEEAWSKLQDTSQTGIAEQSIEEMPAGF